MNNLTLLIWLLQSIVATIWILSFFFEEKIEKRFPKLKHNVDIVATALSAFLLCVLALQYKGEVYEDFSFHHANVDGLNTLGLIAAVVTIVVFAMKLKVTKIISYLAADPNPKKAFDKKAAMTFFGSAVIDNSGMTTSSLEACDLRVDDDAILNTPNESNAGGAWSPIGDVTTMFLSLIKGATHPLLVFVAIVPVGIGYFVSHMLVRKNVKKSFLDSAVDYKPNYKHLIAVLIALFSIPVIKLTTHCNPVLAAIPGVIFIATYYLVTHRVLRFTKHELTEIFKPAAMMALMVWQIFMLGQTGLLTEVIASFFMGHMLWSLVVAGILSKLIDNMAVVALYFLIFATGENPIYPLGHPFWIALAVSAGMAGSSHLPASIAGLILKNATKITANKYITRIGWKAGIGWLIATIVAYVMAVTVL